jgi:hypothetical protein
MSNLAFVVVVGLAGFDGAVPSKAAFPLDMGLARFDDVVSSKSACPSRSKGTVSFLNGRNQTVPRLVHKGRSWYFILVIEWDWLVLTVRFRQKLPVPP